MKILFTGASSFTGYWFVKELAEAGHQVTTVFRDSKASYVGVRAERVAMVSELSEPIFCCSFGDASFIKVINEKGPWDLFCHHAADVTDYKSSSFDAVRALGNNTHNIKAVLEALASRGCKEVVLTGTFFEAGEGIGSNDLPSFSPYGLSKRLTYEVFRYYTDLVGMVLKKFVIPNPFGPYEEFRFTSYLVKTWLNGDAAIVDYPDYIRDNIHVSLLAKAYQHFVESDAMKCNPSGYRESQGAFTARFAAALSPRLGTKQIPRSLLVDDLDERGITKRTTKNGLRKLRNHRNTLGTDTEQ